MEDKSEGLHNNNDNNGSDNSKLSLGNSSHHQSSYPSMNSNTLINNINPNSHQFLFPPQFHPNIMNGYHSSQLLPNQNHFLTGSQMAPMFISNQVLSSYPQIYNGMHLNGPMNHGYFHSQVTSLRQQNQPQIHPNNTNPNNRSNNNVPKMMNQHSSIWDPQNNFFFGNSDSIDHNGHDDLLPIPYGIADPTHLLNINNNNNNNIGHNTITSQSIKKIKKKEIEHNLNPLLTGPPISTNHNVVEIKKKDPTSLPSCATCRKAHKKCERPPEAPETCKACLRKAIQCSPATESGRRRPTDSQNKKKVVKHEISDILGPTGTILPTTSSPFLRNDAMISDQGILSPDDSAKKKRRHERRISKTSSVVEQVEKSKHETDEMFKGLTNQIATFRNSKRFSLPPRQNEQYLSEFRSQEKQRYQDFPNKTFTYNLCGIKYVSTPAIPQSKDRDSCLLNPIKPQGVTFMGLVRDAVARMPGGVGSWQDIVGLIKDSNYLKHGISDSEIKNAVSTALIRLQNESDNSVNFIRDLQFWLYLHKNRESDVDFQPIEKRILPESFDVETQNFDWTQSQNLIDSDDEESMSPMVTLPYVEPYVPTISTDDERDQIENTENNNLNPKLENWVPLRNEIAWRWKWIESQLDELLYQDKLIEEELKSDLLIHRNQTYPWRPIYDEFTFLSHPLSNISSEQPLKKAKLDVIYSTLELTPFPDEVVLKIKNKQKKSRQDEVLRIEVFSLFARLRDFMLKSGSSTISKIVQKFSSDIYLILERVTPNLDSENVVLLILQYLKFPQCSSDYKRNFVSVNNEGEILEPLVTNNDQGVWTWISNDKVDEDILTTLEILFFFGLARGHAKPDIQSPSIKREHPEKSHNQNHQQQLQQHHHLQSNIPLSLGHPYIQNMMPHHLDMQDYKSFNDSQIQHLMEMTQHNNHQNMHQNNPNLQMSPFPNNRLQSSSEDTEEENNS